MAPNLCFRNKYGHCKMGETCLLTHINIICDIEECQVASCENRHPTECFWFKEYKWCKFKPCSYKHITAAQPNLDHVHEDRTFQIGLDLENKLKERDNSIHELTNKINDLERKVVMLETTENNFPCEHCDYVSKSEKKLRQHMKKNHIETDQNKTLEDDCCEETRYLFHKKIKKLERVVLNLEVETMGGHYFSKDDSWGDDGTLESLIRRNSHELKCDECEFITQSTSKLETHIENKHEHKCEICGECCVGKQIFDEHIEVVHNNSEKPMTDSEMDKLNYGHAKCILKGPDTPRKEAYQKYKQKLRPK